MSSYRSYSDTGAYRSRTSHGIASTFGRNASGGSNLPSCRSSYSGVGSSSARAAKERALAGFGGTFLKKDKFEEKPTFKYSCAKDTDKSRLHPGRSSSEDVRAKSPLSDSRSSLLEKYSFSAGKTSERPPSVLDRYNRPASREKSREPEGISRYGSSTYPGSSFARSYGNDGRIEKKDHPPVSYRGLRPNSGKTSRETSPEVSVGKTNSFRVYSRAPSYTRSPSTSESSSAATSRFGSTAGSRFLSSRSGNERVSATINYPAGGRFRNLNGKSINRKEEEEEEESRRSMKSDKDGHHKLPKVTNRLEEDETNNKLPDSEFVTLTVATRGTSPTLPASSSYVRSRRAEISAVHQNEVIRVRKLPDTMDEEVQCDQTEETSRFSRYGGNRVSSASWSTYLDKYSGASSTGSPSVYASRGFTNAGSSNRLNNFAYTRTNEASAKSESSSKESTSVSQEIYGSDNKGQNEKLLGSNCTTTNVETASNDSKTPSGGQDVHGANKEERIHGSERCCCGARKIEANGGPGNLRGSNHAFYRREDSTQDSPDASRCDEYNQRRPSVPRLERTSSKNEVKIPKCSSKTDITLSKPDACSERRGSTPKSDADSSSRTDESLRIVEGRCEEQTEEVISQKRDISQRKDSTSSGPSQNRSASTSQTRNVSAKNTPRQMTRTGSSDGPSVSMPIGRSKSSSASSVTSQGVKIKTTTPPSSGKSSTGAILPSVNLRQGGSPDARGKPPVPKNDTTAATSKCNVAARYVNKDFRKSTLNMENGDSSSCSKYARRKKSQRNISAQDSETPSEQVPQAVSSGSMTSMKSGCSRFRTPSGEPKPVLRRNGSNGSMKWEETKGGSKSPCGTKKRPSGTFSSSNSSRSTSANSSSSEDDDDRTDKTGSRRRRKRTLESPAREVRGKISAGSSRTSVLASSADDMSMMTEKPPRPPSSPRSKSDRSAKTEEAKSFLMRALAPMTNFFKKGQDSDDTSKSDGWVDSIEENHDASNKSGEQLSSSRSVSQNLSKGPSFSNSQRSDGVRRSGVKIQRQYSGEKPWWLDPNSDNIPEGIQRASPWNNDVSQDTTISTTLPDDGKYKLKIWRQGSEEHAWWLDDTAAEDAKKSPSPVSPVSRRGSSRGSFRSVDRRNRIRHQQSGERAWWMSDDPENVPEGIQVIPVVPADSQSTDNPVDNESPFSSKPLKKIRHIESGEKAWWMDSSSNVPDGVVRIPVEISNSTSDSSESYEKIDIGVNPEPETCVKRSLSRFPIEFPPPPSEPLGDRASPEGVENPPDPPDNYGGRKSPYDNVQSTPARRLPPRKRPSTLPLFIGEHTNIDDVLGDTAILCHSPVLSRVRKQERVEEDSPENSSECEEIDATQVIIHDSTPKTPVIQRRNRDDKRIQPDGYIPLDDTALQLYKGGDYGAYLDLEASINEQQEEFEGFHEGESRKNAIILRTQLSVRVHTIIEKLLNSEGRELRRALFSLKQIFQEDKDLVHEFVQNDGLACLIKVSSEADQNYQNYILRALGQVMLYVDGMNGVMEHGQTVEWLYTLIASRFRLVVKTALKLLLVFVEYVETNSLLLVRAVRAVDQARGVVPWINVMKLLKDYDAADTELLIYATTLINKCLNGIPDQDTYYDQVDCLEEQGMEGVIQRYMSKQGTDLDLLRQFQIYEAVLHHEDGDRGSPIRQLDDNIRKTLRNRKSLVDSHERRKSRRHSTGNSPLSMSLNARLSPRLNHSLGVSTLNNTLNSNLPDDDDESSSQSSQGHLGEVQLNGSYKENKVDVGVTPALRRRRERAERQRSFIREQQEATANMRASLGHTDDQESQFATNSLRYTNGTSYERNVDSPSNKLSRTNSRKDLTPLMNAANKLDSEEKKPWYGKSPNEGVEYNESNHTDEDEDRRVVLQLKREGTVKDLTQKLAAQNLIPSSPVEEKVSRIGDMSGLISKAKEGLAKSKSKADVLKSPTGDNLPKLQETKKSENELHWEELVKKLKRPLALCDLDFTDLNSEDEIDVLGSANVTNGVPPPPPPMAPTMAPPNGDALMAPPPPPLGARLPPPLPQGPPLPFGVSLKTRSLPNETSSTPKSPPSLLAKKSKKTVKLFWKEVRDDPNILARLNKHKMIWDELTPVAVDTQKLEHLFESRAKDLITKEKQQEMNKNKEIIVLNHKRSNAINIGMTKLPPPRSIKTAILKMDATIMNREGIEKLLTMLPTKEEKSRIQEAQAANPDLPLGSAEQFLLTLTSISELPARLKLWAFKLDFENSEKEIADPLMDLKQGMETLRVNKTFRGILSTLLSIGIFLNGNEVKGFQLEYLVKVPEVKDTVHKHSLLHHLCHMVMEKFPDSTDLYSEIGAVTRASKIDFDELAANIAKLENECKASWDHLKLIAKHDGSTMMKVKMSDFLADCAERIIVLDIVHRRIINRFRKFILWLGIPLHRVQDTKPNEFCRIVSEFALEYRTTRERVIQQLEKKANHRERNKTRGKMITEVGKFRTKEDRADAELRQLLGSDISDVESIHGTLPWRRQKKDGRIIPLGPVLRDESTNGNLADGVDELLESLVKTATKTPATRTTPRERKRTRHADLKRSRTRENNTTPEGYQP